MAEGVADVLPSARVMLYPLSDGGEGLLNVLLPPLGGEIRKARVAGPLPGQQVDARWGFVKESYTGIIEMAEASGLGLVPVQQRNPLFATTFGMGQLMRYALDEGARTLLVGIGGSATNDGGAGMARALGVHFRDAQGSGLPPGGAALLHLASIDTTTLDPRLADTHVIVASDVRNPLTGPEGASAVFGPQKGATPEEAQLLDAALEVYRKILLEELHIDVQSIPGSGAAGGTGAALAVFCKAEMRPGIDVVLDAIHFNDHLQGTDLVITGEGRLDDQTASGKAMAGVLRRAQTHGVRVAAVVGSVEGDPTRFKGADRFCEVRALVEGTVTVEAAIRDAAKLTRMRAAQLIRDLFTGGTPA
jgi:glycerate 2-kinase